MEAALFPNRLDPAARWSAANMLVAVLLLASWLSSGAAPAATTSVGAIPAAAPDGCGGGPAGDGRVYLGAWIPAALDDPHASHGSDPLGQYEGEAGKGVSILQRWEHWGLGPGGRIDVKWLRRVAENGAYP